MITDPGTHAVCRALMVEGQAVAEKLGVKFAHQRRQAHRRRRRGRRAQDLDAAGPRDAAVRSRSRRCSAPWSRCRNGSASTCRSAAACWRWFASAPRCANALRCAEMEKIDLVFDPDNARAARLCARPALDVQFEPHGQVRLLSLQHLPEGREGRNPGRPAGLCLVRLAVRLDPLGRRGAARRRAMPRA